MGTLKVGIDARLEGGRAGGVESMILGLAHGLGALTDGDEEYHFITYPGPQPWLDPHLTGPCRRLSALTAPKAPSLFKTLERAMRRQLHAWMPVTGSRSAKPVKVPRSDGTAEAAGIEVLHLPLQNAFLTDIPSLYHPHDLQHLHLPAFFSPGEIARREVLYRAFCAQAQLVPVVSSWGKEDLVRQYGLAPDKVAIVHLAPLNEMVGAQDPVTLRSELGLPETFAFYAAQTWPHKNHLNLLKSLALLRDRHGLLVPLVSSGRKTEYMAELERTVRDLGLQDQVRFLGFVSYPQLLGLYEACRCVVIPSRFEAASFPLWEAFQAGRPAACSNVTSLPKQAGDAALIFNPEDPGAIAEALRRLWTEEVLCVDLVARGRANVARFTWERTARTFRAHYRRLAGRPLTNEDHALLEAPPLI